MKRTFFIPLLSAVMICTGSFAQAFIKGQKTIGGSANDYATNIVTTSDGIICGGSSYSGISGEKTENSRGENDYWLVKLNRQGNIVLDKTIGGNAGDYLEAFQQTGDGGYMMAGYSASGRSGEKTENSRGEVDYWIIKLDKAGKIEWDKTIGGSKGDYLKSARQTSDGGYILGGYSYSNISGEKTENTRGAFGETDFWVVKLNRFGQIEWDKTLGGDNADFLYAVDATNDGGCIVGGYSQSGISGEKTGANRGVVDYWVVKLDASGNIEWDKTIGGDKYDNLAALQQTRDGGYILGGSSESGIAGERTEQSRGYFDYWIVKLDRTGNIQWDKAIGGSGVDGFTALQQTSDNGYILGGVSYSNISGEKTEYNRGEGDYWVVKLNRLGQFEWDKTAGGFEYEELWDVREVQKDVYVLAGSSASQISEDKTEAPRGGYDYWIVAIQNANTGITIASSENQKAVRDFLAYPNPATDLLHVQLRGKASLCLTTASGQVLLTTIINGNGVINISRLQPGLYYLRNNTTGQVQKIVVIN